MKTSDEAYYESHEEELHEAYTDYLHEAYEAFIADLLVNEGSTMGDLMEREPFDQWAESDTEHLSFAEWRKEL